MQSVEITNIICEAALPTKITTSPKIIEVTKAIGRLRIFDGLITCIYIIGNNIKQRAVIEKVLPAGLKAIVLANANGRFMPT